MELKFLAWHKPTKRLFEVYTLGSDAVFEDSMDGVGSSPTLPAERLDCEILIYTGLRDADGRRIFSGYIVENSAARWEVIFNTGCFCGRLIGGSDGTQNMHLALRAIKGIKIIGNIYQNPELLNK